MSQSIWTQCGGKSNLALISQAAYRANASNFNQAVLKLVSTLEEYEVLEGMIDSVKRIGEDDTLEEAKHLHYVVRCSYRYPPLSNGSRFGTRDKAGIWYGATDKETVLAESAYYRFRLILGSAGLASVSSQATYAVYDVALKTSMGVYLNRPPFDAIKSLADKVSYSATQALGDELRGDAVEAVIYNSARCRGLNIAVFSPRAFEGKAAPISSEVWHCQSSSDRVIFIRSGTKEGFEFPIHLFEHNGKFPIAS